MVQLTKRHRCPLDSAVACRLRALAGRRSRAVSQLRASRCQASGDQVLNRPHLDLDPRPFCFILQSRSPHLWKWLMKRGGGSELAFSCSRFCQPGRRTLYERELRPQQQLSQQLRREREASWSRNPSLEEKRVKELKAGGWKDG